VLYVDTSALVRAYMADEADHAQMRSLLLHSTDVVVTSEICRVEFGAAAARAARAGRIGDPVAYIRRFDADCAADGSIALLPFDRDTVVGDAQRLTVIHGLKALNAIHLAVALAEERREGNSPAAFVFVTRDLDQAAAAEAEGLTVA